mgnify:CR=1 FL=1
MLFFRFHKNLNELTLEEQQTMTTQMKQMTSKKTNVCRCGMVHRWMEDTLENTQARADEEARIEALNLPTYPDHVPTDEDEDDFWTVEQAEEWERSVLAKMTKG